jgi:hypothetical protein
VTVLPENEMTWSRIDCESRIPPLARRAMAVSACSSAFTPSALTMRASWAAMTSSAIGWNSRRWQREVMVGRTLSDSVVARMNFTQGGGSSSVLRSALKASLVSWWTSSMMKTLNGQADGRELALVADALGVLEAAVGRGVDLDDVEAAALLDREADRVVDGEVGLGAAGAVERLGEDARGGRLAGAARADEKVGVGQAASSRGRCGGSGRCAPARPAHRSGGAPAAGDDLEAGFGHVVRGKGRTRGVSTERCSAYSHSIVAGGLDETS